MAESYDLDRDTLWPVYTTHGGPAVFGPAGFAKARDLFSAKNLIQ